MLFLTNKNFNKQNNNKQNNMTINFVKPKLSRTLLNK